MRNRLLALALGVVMALSLLPAAAAEEAVPVPPEDGRRMVVNEIIVEEDGSDPAAGLLDDAAPDYEGAMKAIREGIVARSKEINLSGLGIPNSDGEGMGAMTHYLAYRYADLFDWGIDVPVTDENGEPVLGQDGQPLTKRQAGVFVGTSSGYIRAYRPNYDMSEREYTAAKALYDRELDAIIAQVPDGLTDEQKVLFIHDYLAANYAYDYTYENNNAYTYLRDGTGVCQSYMLVFSALMDKLKIPVSYVESDELNHAWNVVKLGEKWYHVDVTHDDPSYGGIGEIRGGAKHGYFLISDARSEELRGENTDWNYGEEVVCDDDSYEAFYAAVHSPVIYVPGEDAWYYACADEEEQSNRGVYRLTRGEEGETLPEYDRELVYDYNYIWQRGGEVAMRTYGGSLFFSDLNHVYRHDLDSQGYGPNDSRIETLVELKGYVGGFVIEDGVLSYYDCDAEQMTALETDTMPWKPGAAAGVGAGCEYEYLYDFGCVRLRRPAGADDPDPKGLLVLVWSDPETGMIRRIAKGTWDGAPVGEAVADKDLNCRIFYIHQERVEPLAAKLAVHTVETGEEDVPTTGGEDPSTGGGEDPAPDDGEEEGT